MIGNVILIVLNLLGCGIHLLGVISCYRQKDRASVALFSCMATLFLVNVATTLWR